eukprot:EG_transcript_4801
MRRQNSANQQGQTPHSNGREVGTHGSSWPNEVRDTARQSRRSVERPARSSSPHRSSSNPTTRGSLRDPGKHVIASSVQPDEILPWEQPNQPTEGSRIRAKFRLNENRDPYSVPNAQSRQAEAEVTLEDLSAVPRDGSLPPSDRPSPRQPLPPNPPSAPPAHSPGRAPPQPVQRAGAYFRSQPAAPATGSPSSPSKPRSGAVQAVRECRDIEAQRGQPPASVAAAGGASRGEPPAPTVAVAQPPEHQFPGAVDATPDAINPLQLQAVVAEPLQLQLLLDAATFPSDPAEHLQRLVDTFAGCEDQQPLMCPTEEEAPCLRAIISCFPADENSCTHLRDFIAVFQVNASCTKPTACGALVEPASALSELCAADPTAGCPHLRLLVEATVDQTPTSPTSGGPKLPTSTESVWQPYEEYVYTRLKQDREVAAACTTASTVATSPGAGTATGSLTLLARPHSSSSPPGQRLPSSPLGARDSSQRRSGHAPRWSPTSPTGARLSPNSGSLRGPAGTASPTRTGRRVSATRDQPGRRSNSGPGAVLEPSGALAGPSMCGPAVRRRDRDREGRSGQPAYGTPTLSREELERAQAHEGSRVLEKAREKGRIVRQWIDGLVGS